MSVSGGMFSNLDNFKRTPLSGGDSRRPFGTTAGAIDREARRLRRSGNTQGANQLSTAAAMQRLEDRDRFGSSLVSREQRMDAEAADLAETEKENQFKSSMRDAYLNMASGGTREPESATSTPTSTTTPATGTTTPDTGIPMVGPPDSADPLAIPTSRLGKLAFGNKMSMGGSSAKFRQGLDRAIGMSGSAAETSDLKKVALDSGITEDQFQKRIDYWNSKKKTR